MNQEKTMKTKKKNEPLAEIAARRTTRHIERDERQTRLGRASDHELKMLFAKPKDPEAIETGWNGIDRKVAETAEALVRTTTSLVQRLTEAAERVREAETASEANAAAGWLRTSEFEDLRRQIAHLEAFESMATKTTATQRCQ